MPHSFTSFKDFRKRYPIRPNDEGSLLGSGSYGRVFKVEDQLETEWVAVKISEFKGSDPKSLKAEVELAQRVPRQANIARYDACYRLETDTSISDFAIMKYYPDGNLADLLRHETLNPTQIYDITRGILLGLQHLHNHRIVHRDFKPANILISRDNAGRFVPKIADFGLSRLVSDDELDSSDFDLSDGRGTPSYKAPEQIEGSRVSFNLDLWAFGVILYEILTGEKPFRADLRNSSEQSVRHEIEKKIMSVELPARVSQIDEPYQAMIRRCLVRDIHERVRKEDELLDLLDGISRLLTNATQLAGREQYKEAIPLFEQILSRREHHAEAEAGLAQCQSVLATQHLASLLREAEEYKVKLQFNNAQNSYEQVLRIDPAHQTAARGLALCIDKLRPEPVAPMMSVTEKTDIYQEQTDTYQASEHALTVMPSGMTATHDPVIKEAILTTANSIAPRLIQAGSHLRSTRLTKPTVPWKVVTPIGLGLMGLVLYYNIKTAPPAIADQTNANISGPSSPLKAGIIPVIPKGDESSTKIKPTPVPVPVSPKDAKGAAAITKRVDVALDKAREAYAEKKYELVVTLTNSALQLDPTRREAAAMRDAAIAAQQRTDNSEQKEDNPDVAKAEAVKPSVPEPNDTEKALNAKKEAQEKYDQLIDDGVKAINNGNNKTKAIADFSNARALAGKQDMNTAKGDEAYSQYMTKADRFFDREEYEGAKSWYSVAQALKDTPDVRKRIKQCTNQ